MQYELPDGGVLGVRHDAGYKTAQSVDGPVAHGDHAQVLLLGLLAAGREFGDGRGRRRLGGLTAGIRVHFRIEHQHVDVEAEVQVPVILFYPGTRSGTNSLRFMDSLDAVHGYRHKIY